MKNKAVFLDRDGVLIVDKHQREKTHLKSVDEIEFLPGVVKAIRKLNEEFLVIVVANQSSVARGLVSFQKAEQINRFIVRELQKKGCRIDAVYFCPHHPDFSGKCNCRKPKTGLFRQADRDFRINFRNSFMIGDKTTDIAAGKKMGCKTILVKTGYGGKDRVISITPDATAKNILEAAEWLLHQDAKKNGKKSGQAKN